MDAELHRHLVVGTASVPDREGEVDRLEIEIGQRPLEPLERRRQTGLDDEAAGAYRPALPFLDGGEILVLGEVGDRLVSILFLLFAPVAR